MIGLHWRDAHTLALTVEDEADQAVLLDVARAAGLRVEPAAVLLPRARVATVRQALGMAAALYTDAPSRRIAARLAVALGLVRCPDGPAA